MDPVPVIPEFYAGKKILITGATGFVGKVLIWKLLHSCPRIDTIYVIIRAKWGKNDKQRLKELFDFPIFDNFKKDNPKMLEKVVLIPGDMLMKDFNLAESDKKKLQEEVSVVFHIAAILKMDATLKQAVGMNVEATLNLLNICANMKNLKVFVYVSTTYCYCDRDKTDNKVYPAKHSPYDIMQTVGWMDDEMLKKLTPSIIKPHPNTYTYSKRLAESLVSDFHPRLPVVIARPSIIISSHKEPFPGYIDNLNGVIGIMMAVGKGVLRSLYSNPKYQANVICVDNVCNSLIGIAWQVAESEKKSSYLPVYNVTMSEDETPTWEDVMKTSMTVYFRYPFSLVLWYPSLTMNTNKIVHVISTVLFQWIPAYFIDLLILISGFKPFMVRVQKKISLGSNLLSYFTIRQWKFDNSNVIELRNSMNESDRALFPVSATVKTVEAREEYVTNATKFVRSFLGKDDPESIPRSIRNMKILYIVDRLLKLVFFAGILWLICKICFSK